MCVSYVCYMLLISCDENFRVLVRRKVRWVLVRLFPISVHHQLVDRSFVDRQLVEYSASTYMSLTSKLPELTADAPVCVSLCCKLGLWWDSAIDQKPGPKSRPGECLGTCYDSFLISHQPYCGWSAFISPKTKSFKGRQNEWIDELLVASKGLTS